MSKKERKRTLAINITVILLFVAALSLAIVWHMLHDPSFPMFAPSTLPVGVEVKSHQITDFAGDGEHLRSLQFVTNTANFTITESKSSAEQYAVNSYNCSIKIENSTCVVLTSSKGQTYNTRTDFDTQHKAFSETVMWLRGTTVIWITLNKDQVQKYPDDYWGTVIDGFTTANYSNEPVKTTTFSTG